MLKRTDLDKSQHRLGEAYGVVSIVIALSIAQDGVLGQSHGRLDQFGDAFVALVLGLQRVEGSCVLDAGVQGAAHAPEA